MADKDQYSFFAFLSRMRHIYRWSLMRNVNRENIMEHSLQVAMIAHGLAVINNKIFGGNADPEKTALLAIYHDSNETITGDLPTPIKYFNQGMESSYKDLETISKHKLLSLLPEELAESYKEILFYDETSLEGRLVKAADRICAYIKCVEELKAGNAEFQKAQQSILKRILGLNLPEIDYFMNHFMYPFCLTLDELN
ncbi:MAG: 5'-deoxynucleotidase [Acetivibrionales bacterium]|jgi:5'-deoxynucleotidase|nr:5'-deoxynucleotidase [Clostridiaceae bacterium]